MIRASGYSALQLVFGSNPVDLFGEEEQDEDLLFAYHTCAFTQQSKLRMRAHEAVLKEVANSTLQRILAYSGTFNCTEIKIGESALFYATPNRKSAPQWMGTYVRPGYWCDLNDGALQ